MTPSEFGKFLVISLGTGTEKREEKYTAEKAAKWGIIGWLFSDRSTPLIDVFMNGSADMVHIHISVVFQALKSEDNYLRIQVRPCNFLFEEKESEWSYGKYEQSLVHDWSQDDTLAGDASSVDVSTAANLKNLVKIGEDLLEKPVSRLNLDTGRYETTGKEKNMEALRR